MPKRFRRMFAEYDLMQNEVDEYVRELGGELRVGVRQAVCSSTMRDFQQVNMLSMYISGRVLPDERRFTRPRFGDLWRAKVKG